MTARQSSRPPLAARLTQEFHPRRLLPSLAGGLVAGIIAVTVSTAFAALIFSGRLSAYLPAGIGLMLFGSIVASGLTALTSSLPSLVASLQESPVVILALVSAAVVRNMPASAAPHAAFVTFVAAIALASLLTGTVFWLLGQFKLGNMIRFIPYPVIGGFLAGSGLLLVLGAISVMVDAPVSLFQLAPLVQPGLLIKWMPGLFFAVTLLVVVRRYSHVLIVPGMLLGAIAVFYAVLWLTRTPLSEAAAQGWLLGSLPTGGGGLWQPLTPSDLAQVNWPVLGSQAGNLAAVAVVSVIAILLNATGIELATGQDMDLNRELRASGIANLVAGLGSGMVGFHALSDSMLIYKMGARSRLVGLVLAAVCGVVMLAGGSLLSLFPTPVLGGLLFFLGLDFLVTWVYDAWFKLPHADYLIVLLILAVIDMAGFLQGVGLGVVLAAGLFVFEYSRVNVVKHTLSGVNRQSNVDRPRLYQQLLCQKGDWLHILELQGFIFFGTANRLLEQVRQRAHDPGLPSLHFVVLDFRLVTGFDSSAVFSFAKMTRLARAQQVTLVFTQLPPGMQRQLERELLRGDDQAAYRIFPDLDHGVEWCEDRMIEIFESVGFGAKDRTLMKQLEKALPAQVSVASLMSYFERQDVEQGYYLICQGDRSNGLYFVEAGQVTVQLEHGDGTSTRLRTMGPGTVIGERGLYSGGNVSAAVVADQPTTLVHLSADNLRRMEETSPEIAAAFHKFIAGLLSERLATMSDTVQALLGSDLPRHCEL